MCYFYLLYTGVTWHVLGLNWKVEAFVDPVSPILFMVSISRSEIFIDMLAVG